MWGNAGNVTTLDHLGSGAGSGVSDSQIWRQVA